MGLFPNIPSNSVIRVHAAQNHMATTFHLTLCTESGRRGAAEQVLAECHREIHRCELELSEFLEVSPIYRLNHTQTEDVELTQLGIELIQQAEALRLETEDAFHFGAKGTRTPNPPFAWDLATRRIRKLTPQAWLGFGAIGKGFALDKARSIIEREGFFHFCLNAGGSSILLSGCAAPDVPWRWAWSWQRSNSGPVGIEFEHRSTRPIAIGVSGTQEKGAHLVRTSGGSGPALQSALVATDSAAAADALSTALYSAGWDRFFQLAALPKRELSVAAIDAEGAPCWNGLFQKVWGGIETAAFGLLVSIATLVATPVLADDEVVDLGDTAVQQFNPYTLERDPLWALLPVAALFLVALHLRRPPKYFQKP